MGTTHQDYWPKETQSWTSDDRQTISSNTEIPESLTKITLDRFIQKSNDFPVGFPDNATRCLELQKQTSKENLEENVNSAYVLLHEQVLKLILSFLHQKRRFGTNTEREFYKNMTVVQFIDRLLTKRAVSFFGHDDNYLLIDGTNGKGGWENIGTEDEKPPLTLENCLSFDEINISALLVLSSRTFFLNNGQIENRGYVLGAAGPRLDKQGVMESREIIKSRQQNTHLNGYGQFFVPTMQGIFSNFWGDVSATFEEWQWRKGFEDNDRFLKIDEDTYFDKLMYEKRLALSIDCVLLEANERAKKEDKEALVYLTGLGLEKWRIIPKQGEFFMTTVKKRVEFLGQILSNISDVIFPKLGNESVVEKIPIKEHPQSGISLQMLAERPNKLTEDDQDKLLVVVYNWDANSVAGNEYWLHNSGAISNTSEFTTTTQVAELHNPFINTNIGVENLRIVTVKGITKFSDYIKNM